MPKLKSYGVFISHAWDYDADYDSLVKMLDKAKRFNWRNYSVPEHDPLHAKTDAELEKALRDQIRPVNAVLIISGMYVNNRKWIQKEIDLALEMKKKIIGLAPHGAQKLPLEVQEVAPIVGWGTPQIVDAIRRPTVLKPEKQDSVATSGPSGPSSPANQWNKDITDSPDFSELHNWIENPDDRIRKELDKRGKSIERRRGMSG